MPVTQLTLGVQTDRPMMSPDPFIWSGQNIRVRADAVETLGLYGPLMDVNGDQIVGLGTDIHRRVFITPSITTGQILMGSVSNITLIEYDATSTPATGTRWSTFDITPTGLPAVPPPGDGITVPSAGRVAIPPVWWFADQEDLVVGSRANVNGDQPYVWDRVRTNPFAPITLARHPTDPFWPAPIDSGDPFDPASTPIPIGAVGGGIINRILVLLGCTSFTDPDPARYMTIRWSDRFNFGQWTPSDITLSGETQLEGGSRIVGGGVVGFGVIAWTDKRMALLRETFDFDVFSREYIDGGRGLLANQAWTEADGQVWWLDETRTLNVYDGGRPRQIINNNRYATIERLSNAQAARVYLEPNHEYGEVIIHYPQDVDTEIDAQLVYNYLHDCWYPWSLPRSGWSQRYGVIPNIAVDQSNLVWQHDLDVNLASPWLPASAAQTKSPDQSQIEPLSFSFQSNLITQADPSYTAWNNTKVTLDYLPSPALGATDTFDVTVTGYRTASLKDVTYSITETFNDGDVSQDYRVGGKAIQFEVSGTDIKTVYRFGLIDIAAANDGER